MPERARAVVIGGGVGGFARSCTGWRAWAGRLPARRAGRAHERVQVPLRGSGRAVARLAQPDPDDDALRRAVPVTGRRGRPRHGVARRGSTRTGRPGRRSPVAARRPGRPSSGCPSSRGAAPRATSHTEQVFATTLL